jgi:SPP1 gp7 family putative phage head morphogenesis protein
VITVGQLLAVKPKKRGGRKYTRAARLERVPLQPRGLELAYASDLLHLATSVHALIRSELFPVLSEIALAETVRADILVGQVANRFRFLVEETRRKFQREDILPVIESTAVRLDKINKQQMQKALGINLLRDGAAQARMAQFRETNVRLIQSIPERLLSQVDDVLAQSQIGGLRVEEIRDRIEERFDVSESRAALIARDQVLKANADLTSARQQDAGITEYVWTTVGDARVRPEHRALDGSRHSWLVAPASGPNGEHEHPGKGFQCRCFPDPVLPE